MLSNISKVLERIIYNKIIDHIASQINQPLNNSATLTLLINDCNQLDVIYLDISKAFNTVSHPHLLTKLYSFNIGCEIWLWFQAYITHQRQYVSINSSNSYLFLVESGIPQGSILGPLLFIIYVNDIPDSVFHSLIYLFADDTKCFKRIKQHGDKDLLQSDINCLFNWSTTSHLSFHPPQESPPVLQSEIFYILHNQCNSLTTHKDLSILISSDLEWSLHQDNILTKAYKTLGLIQRTFSNSISSLALSKLYVSLNRSQLMYCSPVWRPHLIKDITKLEQLQHRATKYILPDYNSDYKSRLTNLNLLPVMYVFELSDIKMFFIKNIKYASHF